MMTDSQNKIDSNELMRFCIAEAESKLGENIVAIDAREGGAIADFFILVGATSTPHLRALYSTIERQVREKFALRPRSTGGSENSGWVLIDFNDVVVHLMTKELRERYQLEALWDSNPSCKELEKATEEARNKK